MFKSILTAAIVSVGLASAAIALPAAPSSSQLSVSSDVIQVKKGDWNHKGNWNNNKKWSNKGKKGNWKYGKKHYNNNFYAGRKYNYRYSSRPWGWQSRGCVLVGPVWLCP